MMRLAKKKRLLKYAGLIFVLYFVYSFTFKNYNNMSFDADQMRSFRLQIDDTFVDTSMYAEDYENYLQMKRRLNQNFKTIERDKREIKNGTVKNGKILILEYTKVWGETRYCQFFKNNNDQPDEQIFIKQCPYKNCIFTCDTSQYAEAHAVLFHESDLKNEVEKNPKLLAEIEQNRKPNQVWFLWNDEANRVNPNLDQYKFNWTMSYRYDAEISDCSYGCKYKQNNIKRKKIDSLILLNFNVRKNKALWFVSNCNSEYRINFALKLQNYFPIEIFGQCKYKFTLKKKFPSFSNTYLGGYMVHILNGIFDWSFENEKCKSNSQCEINQLQGNKFYLSFESKNCTNYITEKFWRTLRSGLIPVVFQPNREFYEMIAPPNSYIHAQDFDFDAEKLASYLNLVSDDFKYYTKHMAWRYDYDVVFSAKQCENRRLCELCTRLNSEKSNIYYNSVSSFFNDNCVIN